MGCISSIQDGSRRKRKLTVRAARRAAADVTGMFAAAYRAELRAATR